MKKNSWIILLAVMVSLLMFLSFMDIIDTNFGMSLSLELFVFFDIVVALVARKNKVKVVEWLMIILAVIGVGLFALNFFVKTKKNATETKFQIVAVPDISEKTLRFTYDGREYYTYNIEDVSVIMNDEEESSLSLQAALLNKKVTLEEILALAIPNNNTTGYKIYYDGGGSKYDNDKYSIVLCENDTKDIIFSKYEYTFDESICE